MIRMMGRYGAVLTILALLATAPAYGGKTTILVPEPGYAPKVGDRAVLYSLDNEAIPSDLWCATTSQGCRTYLASLFAEENGDEKEAEDGESGADHDKPGHEEGIVHLAPKTDVQLLARESVELPGVNGAPPVKCHYFAVQILSGPFQGKTLYTLDFHITRLVEPTASAASDGDRAAAATESAPPLVPIALDNPSAPPLSPPSSSSAAKPADTIPATATAPPPIALADSVDVPKAPRVENETPAPPSRPGTADAPTPITLELEVETASAPAPAEAEPAQATPAPAPAPGVVVSTPALPLEVEPAVPTLEAAAPPKVIVSEPADALPPPKIVASEPADAPAQSKVVSEPADALPLPAADDRPTPAPRVTLQDVPTGASSEAAPPLAPLPPLKVVASEPADAPAPAPAPPSAAADEAPAPAPRMTLPDEPAVASTAAAPPAQSPSPPITPLPDDAPRAPEVQGAHSAPLAHTGDLPPSRPEPNPGRATATGGPTRPQPASTAPHRPLPPLFATPAAGSAPEMLAAAQRWDAAGKSLDALASYRRLIHAHPASSEARIAALRLNLLSDALEAEAMEGRAARILEQARALEAKGDGTLALEYLQQIVSAYPKTPTARQAQERIRTLAVQPRTQPSAAVRR